MNKILNKIMNKPSSRWNEKISPNKMKLGYSLCRIKFLPVCRPIPKRPSNGGFFAIGALAAVAPHLTVSIPSTLSLSNQDLSLANQQSPSITREIVEPTVSAWTVELPYPVDRGRARDEEVDGIQIDASILPNLSIACSHWYLFDRCTRRRVGTSFIVEAILVVHTVTGVQK